MKALRRSLKSEKTDSKIHHISLQPKDATAGPPKKVIRAMHDYNANPDHIHELSFAKGDFFHVIGRENDTEWYEACNPSMPNARGLVPVAYFQVMGRNERDSAGSVVSATSNRQPDNDSGYSDRSGTNGHTRMSDLIPRSMRMSKSMGRGSGQMVYGVIMYDFKAERPDELDAKAGEAIIVVAQSNPEWFVAKPIGRLGGPGLIPVSFIEIRDMASGQAVPNTQEAVQRAGVPTVEEWKKIAAAYKEGSITLGKFESPHTQPMQQQEPDPRQSNGQQMYYQNPDQGVYQQPQRLSSQEQQRHLSQASPHNSYLNSQSQSPGARARIPRSASIPKWCFANDKYWYIIEAVMKDDSHWELSRFYQDFYDFQIALLTQFPEEAGNAGKPRTLPFMPGPVTYVTDVISNGRRQNLDDYIKKLLRMPPHISECQLVQQLFAPREGDFEADPNATQDRFSRLSGASQPSSNESPDGGSRQSSRVNLNGNGYSAPGLSAPPVKPSHHRQQASLSNGAGQAPQKGGLSELRPPTLDRQGSSLTQASGSSQTTGSANQTGALKIKVYYEDDIIVFRVATNISYLQLKDKLKDRLRVSDNMLIQYKDEPSGEYHEMREDRDLDVAVQRNPKLTLYINYQ
ncbi:MAG: bud emergence protein 1 [Caeruleum heppii]|nr:MAG: bud emergence protein 1 [Caeruleum heppii]